MSILLKLPCYVVAVILGRPTAIAVAYVDHIPAWLAGPVALLVMYAYASFLMNHGRNLLRRAETSRWKALRQLSAFATTSGNELPPWFQVGLVVVLAIVPILGLWLAVGFAAACVGPQRERQHSLTAWIAATSGISLFGAMVLASHITVPLPVSRTWLEVAGYITVPAVAGWRLYRNPLDAEKIHQIIAHATAVIRQHGRRLRLVLATTGLLHG